MCTISAKRGRRWNARNSLPSALVTQLIQRLQKPTKHIDSKQQNDPVSFNYLSGAHSRPNSVTKDTNGMPGVSINRLVDTSRYPDGTINLYSDSSESKDYGANLPERPVHSRHSSQVLRAVAHPWYPPLSSETQEEDSYLSALELSRLPCQRLEDPTDCYDFSQLFPSNQQPIVSHPLEYNAHTDELLKNNPSSPDGAIDFSLFHLLQIKEDFLLQKPFLLLSPNDIEFTVQYIRSS